MLCKLGTFVEYSVFAKEVSLDWTVIGDTKGACMDCSSRRSIHVPELTIHGGHLGPYTYPKCARVHLGAPHDCTGPST